MAVTTLQALQDIATTIDAVNADTVVTDAITPIVDSAASTDRKILRVIDAILANAVLTASVETAVADLLRPTAVTEAAALSTYTASRTYDGRISAIIAALESEQPPALFINGTRFNFVDKVLAECGPTEIPVGDTLADTLDNIVTVLEASTDTDVDDATYTEDGTDTLTITHDTAGAAGNAFTVAAPFSTATASAATLEDGADAVAAEGSILFADNPSNAETLTLGAETPNWEFVTSGATGPQTNIAGTLAETLAQLVIDLNAAGAPFNAVTWSEDDTSLLAVHDTPGAAGNAFQLGGSGDVTPSAATLEGGADAVAATATIVFSENPTPGEP